jgi:hypothetical protein
MHFCFLIILMHFCFLIILIFYLRSKNVQLLLFFLIFDLMFYKIKKINHYNSNINNKLIFNLLHLNILYNKIFHFYFILIVPLLS